MRAAPNVRAPHPWFSRWFGRYAANRLRKHFHRVRLLKEGYLTVPRHLPLVIYGNHPSWWDPLVALAVKPVFFPGRNAYAPIDAAMLERYGLFKSLGFFGVERDSLRGVASFLDQAETILRRPDTLLFLTPQGRFADVRERPVRLQRGIAHLAARVPETVFLPLAMEIVFWEESKPELLLCAGAAVSHEPGNSRPETLARLERSLEKAMDQLATASMARRSEAFDNLLTGTAGIGGFYDAWRSLKSFALGKTINLHHSNR